MNGVGGLAIMDGGWQIGQSVVAKAQDSGTTARPGTAWIVVTAIFSLQRCKQWSSLSQTDYVLFAVTWKTII